MLGTGANLLKTHAAARIACDELQKIADTLKDNTDFLNDLAESQTRLGAALEKGDTESAVAAYRAAAATRQALAAKDPANFQTRLDHVNALFTLGLIRPTSNAISMRSRLSTPPSLPGSGWSTTIPAMRIDRTASRC